MVPAQATKLQGTERAIWSLLIKSRLFSLLGWHAATWPNVLASHCLQWSADWSEFLKILILQYWSVVFYEHRNDKVIFHYEHKTCFLFHSPPPWGTIALRHTHTCALTDMRWVSKKNIAKWMNEHTNKSKFVWRVKTSMSK